MPSAGDSWTDVELTAAVAAYLDMRAKDAKGEAYSKAHFKRALLDGPLAGRASVDYRMGNISAVLKDMGEPWLPGFAPRSNVGAITRSRIRRIIDDLVEVDSIPRPTKPPVKVSDARKLPPTGYWMLVCKNSRWNGMEWLRMPTETLLYLVSEHNRYEVQPGDLALLRIDASRGSTSAPSRPCGIYAVMEVVRSPELVEGSDEELFSDPLDARQRKWRATVRLLANLVDCPVEASTLPAGPEFDYFRKPLQTASIPIGEAAFQQVLKQARLDLRALNEMRLAGSAEGVRRLEAGAKGRDPAVKERISKVIERGPEGTRVKKKRGYKCQLCEAMGNVPAGFLKRGSSIPYVEAHHVQPVADLVAGSLGGHNIMVLCANHHRQAHFGNFVVVEHQATSWKVEIDGRQLEIDRTVLSPED